MYRKPAIMAPFARADLRCSHLPGAFFCGYKIVLRSSFQPAFYTRAISNYATKTQRAAACKSYSPGKRFNGLFVHSRDLYVLLSQRHCAGVFTGLGSEKTESNHRSEERRVGKECR